MKLIAVALILLVVISGCAAPAAVAPAITSPEEATDAVADISNQVDKVSSTLESLDQTLG